MKAIYIGDNLEFGRDIVAAACRNTGNITVEDFIDTSKYSLGPGDRDSGCTLEWMKENNVLWKINESLDKITDQNSKNRKDLVMIIQSETQFSDGKSLSDCLGLELIKHILLTEHPNLREIKIIALSFFDLHYLIRNKPDNLILISPYVELIQRVVNPETLGNQIAHIVSTYSREFYAEGEDYYRNLNNYVTVLPEEITEANHQKRNLGGIDSLYYELSENDEEYRKKFFNDILSKDKTYISDIWKLYHKKMSFKSRMQWKVDRMIPLSKVEKDAYAEIFTDIGITPEGFTSNDWPKLFKAISKSIKESVQSALVIEDKSYWTEFYKEILSEKLVFFPEKDTAAAYIKKYNDTIVREHKEGIKEFISCVLQQSSYNSTYSGEKFHDLAVVDIFLSPEDEKLAVTGGIELLSRLKKINRLVPVIVCSASKNNEKIRRAIKEGADELFTKDTGGLRYLLLKLFQLSRHASLRKDAGELVNILENKSFSIPCLVPNDDEFWHLYKQASVLTVRDMKYDERFNLVRNIERSITSGEDEVWKVIWRGFIPGTEPDESCPEGCDLWNGIITIISRKFNAYNGKKIVHFAGSNQTYDNTEQMLTDCKPVFVEFTGKDGNVLYVNIINTNYSGTIELKQGLQSGFSEEDFNEIDEKTKLTACRRKYYGMPDKLDPNYPVLLDLIEIEKKDEQQQI